jgi:hypothetical protein
MIRKYFYMASGICRLVVRQKFIDISKEYTNLIINLEAGRSHLLKHFDKPVPQYMKLRHKSP